ncbi:aminodeoxychorismate synthase component I [Flocculibacter collagenilyticus]|uniref:aminodeoxychorismate synthase component I n=1 Tax=Flocculibacter collagenilyticus TaxID=2744479 RepID=UPI0018F41B06|nr:aminodeoxychorismate synthase component I [Flocculibacter collagenilyticus]
MSKPIFIQSFDRAITHSITDLSCVFPLFKDLPWAMLLDSANSNHVNSQYDILVAAPIHKVEAKNNRVFIDGHDVESDPFSAINTTLKKAGLYQVKRPANALDNDASQLPFLGGALGYFGYDTGRYIEKLPQHANNDINIPDMAVGIYHWALIYDNKTRTLWLIDHSDNAQQRFDDISQQLLTQQHININQTFYITDQWSANMSAKDYENKFNAVQRYIREGDCYQINLAQRFSASYSGDEWQAYRLLRKENRAPFSAFLSFDEFSILSISPERFLQLNGQTIQTKPIKGTRPRSTNAEQDNALAAELKAAEKDRAENVMIVDLLRNDISKVSQPGTVKVPHLFEIESFPAVHHLVSTVVGEIAQPNTACDLLRAAFPGGSITGAPKIRAMEIIEELEPHCRTVYCGSIGYICATGNMDTSITIRTLVAKDNTLFCWAGGGLVADSVMHSEYQETYDKVNKILPVLASLNKLESN